MRPCGPRRAAPSVARPSRSTDSPAFAGPHPCQWPIDSDAGPKRAPDGTPSLGPGPPARHGAGSGRYGPAVLGGPGPGLLGSVVPRSPWRRPPGAGLVGRRFLSRRCQQAGDKDERERDSDERGWGTWTRLRRVPSSASAPPPGRHSRSPWGPSRASGGGAGRARARAAPARRGFVGGGVCWVV